MKNIFMALMAILFVACGRNIVSYKNNSYPTSYIDSRGNQQLLGTHAEQDLKQPPFAEWYNKNYDAYSVDSATAAFLKPLVKDKRFEIYMGTWCGDSKREVPRMFKILSYAGVRSNQVRLIMLDSRDSSYKQSPAHEEKGKNIHRVPDLLVYKGGQEMSRIVEYPVVSLEKDLLAILQEQPYQPNYKAAIFLQEQLAAGTAVLSDTIQLAGKIRSMVKSAAELNSLGYVWLAAGEKEKALLAFHVNAMLYPGISNVFDSLAEAYMRLGKKPIAAIYYRKVIELDAGNANALKMLKELDVNTGLSPAKL